MVVKRRFIVNTFYKLSKEIDQSGIKKQGGLKEQ